MINKYKNWLLAQKKVQLEFNKEMKHKPFNYGQTIINLIMELGEVMGEDHKWCKPWKKKEAFSKDKLFEEIADMWIFLFAYTPYWSDYNINRVALYIKEYSRARRDIHKTPLYKHLNRVYLNLNYELNTENLDEFIGDFVEFTFYQLNRFELSFCAFQYIINNKTDKNKKRASFNYKKKGVN